MIDFDKIGKRIYEQRKYFRKLSQERMAEELGMYQADISNMEKAKKGSGITDLVKLDLIAEYLDIPLETLLFGREDKTMLKYYGDKMSLKPSRRKVPKGHQKMLLQLMGCEGDSVSPGAYECGPYMLYSLYDVQTAFIPDPDPESDNSRRKEFNLPRLHTFIFLGNEVIGVMVTALTCVMQHVYRPHLLQLQEMMPSRVLDVTDVYRTLNPYWALWQYTEEETEKEEHWEKMFERMDALRNAGEDRPVLYLESAYVKEDCRQNGIFRMYIDFLKSSYAGCIIWLNLEPTAGTELIREHEHLTNYTLSDIGQMSLDASIAERLGFTIDPEPRNLAVQVLGDDGNEKYEVRSVRKSAYYFPAQIRELVKEDRGLVALGRAKQKIMQQTSEENDGDRAEVDIRDNELEGFWVAEWTESYTSGPQTGQKISVFSAVNLEDHKKQKFGVSHYSVFQKGLNDIPLIEEYDFLEDTEDSEHCQLFKMLHHMALYNAGVHDIKTKTRILRGEDDPAIIRAEYLLPVNDDPEGISRVFIFAEHSPEEEQYAVSTESIMNAVLDSRDEVATLEEYYDYDSSQGSVYADYFEILRNLICSESEIK